MKRSTWVIGDVHGQAELLEALLAALPREAGDSTVFLGDYIDRGPASKSVVQMVLTEIERGAVALWGNHEDMAAAAFGLDSPGKLSREQALGTWLHNGGGETLMSFGLHAGSPCPPELAELFPRLRLAHFEVGGVAGVPSFVCVHGYAPAGLSVTEVVEQAPCIGSTLVGLRGPALLLWGRPSEFERADPGRLVIVGHTPQRDGKPRRIGHHLVIDTGAAYVATLEAARLTAVRMVDGSPVDFFQAVPTTFGVAVEWFRATEVL